MQRKALLTLFAATVIGSSPAFAAAEDTPMAPASPEIVVTATLNDRADDAVIADDDLLSLRGGQALVLGNQTLTAINSGGLVNGDYSAGAISFSDNALANFNGFGNVVVNTGAQNNLLSGLNVTINIGN